MSYTLVTNRAGHFYSYLHGSTLPVLRTHCLSFTVICMKCVSVSKFKKRISDVLKPELDDYDIVKWLKGEHMKRIIIIVTQLLLASLKFSIV